MLNNQVALLWLTPQPTFLWHSRSLNHSRLLRYQKSKSLYTVTVTAPVAQFSVQLVGEELEEFCKMFPAIDRAVIQVRFTIFNLFLTPWSDNFIISCFCRPCLLRTRGTRRQLSILSFRWVLSSFYWLILPGSSLWGVPIYRNNPSFCWVVMTVCLIIRHPDQLAIWCT